MRRLVVGLSIAQAVETVVIVIVVTVPGFAAQSGYFAWPQRATIFDNTLVHTNQIAVLFVLLALSRLSATFHSDIIVPDYTNWMYAESRFLDYSHRTHMLVLVLSRLDSLLRYLLLIQFVLSNVFFVIISAAVDIPVGLVIVNRYLVHKDAVQAVADAVDIMLVESATIDLGFTSSRAQPAPRRGTLRGGALAEAAAKARDVGTLTAKKTHKTSNGEKPGSEAEAVAQKMKDSADFLRRKCGHLVEKSAQSWCTRTAHLRVGFSRKPGLRALRPLHDDLSRDITTDTEMIVNMLLVDPLQKSCTQQRSTGSCSWTKRSKGRAPAALPHIYRQRKTALESLDAAGNPADELRGWTN